MDNFWQDVRFGARMLVRNPGFTAVAVLTLALGIGANTVMFSVVNAVILRPLPFAHPDQLVVVWGTDEDRHLSRATIPPADFLDWRSQNHVFQQMAAWRSWRVTLTGADEPEQVWGVQVSANFFDLLGVKPALGRTFLASEELPGHDQVAILTHGIWVRHFGSNPNLIDQSVTLQGKPFTVVGVLPEGFSVFGAGPRFDFWAPLAFSPADLRRDNPSLLVFARLKAGVTISQAQAEMTTITQRLAHEYPETNKGVGANVASLREVPLRAIAPGLLILLAATGFVLLIACANVANLLLARSAARSREIAVRAALGASRLRLIRQLLIESLILALVGGGIGLLLALAAFRTLPSILPPTGSAVEIPHVNWIGINLSVLAFTVAIALLTGLFFGLAPAFHISRANLSDSLKESSRGSTEGIRAQRMRGLLVMLEMALSLVLLIGAGLLIRSFWELMSVNPGIDARSVLTMQVWLPENKYPQAEQIRAFFRQTIEQARSLPGVKSASAVNFVPFTGWADFTNFEIEGRAPSVSGHPLSAQYRIVDPAYFQTVELPLRRGRLFAAEDNEQAPGAAIISQSLADEYWPTENPVGKQIKLELAEPHGPPWHPSEADSSVTIVGVVGDVNDWRLGQGKPGIIYLPYAQAPSRLMRLVVRTQGNPLELAPAVRHAVLEVDKDQPVTEIKSLDQFISEAASPSRLDMVLLSFFAGLAVALATVGIYGVISYSVAQRAHEIGIRVALGARPSDILKLIVGQGMKVVLIGLAIGLAVSPFLTRLMASLLFGVKAGDPMTFIVVPVLLVIVALVACYLPARRAMRVEPMSALRYE